MMTRLVVLALRHRKPTVEIAVKRPERELAAIRILEPQLAIANDPGAMKNAAGPPCVRSHRPKDVDEGGGAVELHSLDNQRGTEVRRP